MLDLSTRTIQIWFQNKRRNRKELIKNSKKENTNERFKLSALILRRIYEKEKLKLKNKHN